VASRRSYENVGTKFYPNFLPMEHHSIAQAFEALCGLSFTCSASLYDYDRDGQSLGC
jgi:hypothetical protein